MKKTSKQQCVHCKKKFTSDPYNAYHQEYCTSLACRKASRRASSKKYRDRQKCNEQFKQDERKRVKTWRENNPGYWKRNKNEKKSDKNNALRDFASDQIDYEITALRDLLNFQHTVFKGVISQITGALRDNIGSEIRFFYDKGKEISDTGFEIVTSPLTGKEKSHETQKNHLPTTTTARP